MEKEKEVILDQIKNQKIQLNNQEKDLEQLKK